MLQKFQTAGYLGFWKDFPAARCLDMIATLRNKKFPVLPVVFFICCIFIIMLIFRNENHFICYLDESKQTKQNDLYACAATFSWYERIRTCLLLENVSCSYWMLSLEKAVNFLSHTNKRSKINKIKHTNASGVTIKRILNLIAIITVWFVSRYFYSTFRF